MRGLLTPLTTTHEPPSRDRKKGVVDICVGRNPTRRYATNALHPSMGTCIDTYVDTYILTYIHTFLFQELFVRMSVYVHSYLCGLDF